MQPSAFTALGTVLIVCAQLWGGNAAQAAQLARPESPPTTTPLSAITGWPIADDEATKTIARLTSAIYRPYDALKGLKCEFTPHFVKYDPDKSWRRKVRSTVPIIVTSDPLVEFIIFFYDEELLKARKAVFLWQRMAPTRHPDHYPATVLLYDEDNRPLKVHPFIGPALATACQTLFQLDQSNPLAVLPDHPSWKTSWRKDAPRSDENALWQVTQSETYSEGKPGVATGWLWSSREIRCTPDDAKPLSVTQRTWEPRTCRWYPAEFRRFSELGNSGKFATTVQGSPAHPRKSDWVQVQDRWVVKRVTGSRQALDMPGSNVRVPWEIEFTDFEIDTDIPADLLAFPPARPVKMDFSTPDAAVETVMECLRQGRRDLLAHCTPIPPKDPIPDKQTADMLAYMFDRIPEMREQLKVLKKQREGDHWVYRIQIPQAPMERNRSFDARIVPVNDSWRLDADIGLLLFQFWD